MLPLIIVVVVELLQLHQFVYSASSSSSSSSATSTSCKLSEFQCDNGRCIDIDRYCNGLRDCSDGSDEPRHCSACNRTYYGVKSSTYNLQLHNPQPSKSSFTCVLTFVAAGGVNGDLIQLKFNSIFLAKQSPEQEVLNCENTKLIIQEPERQIYSEFCHYSFINKPYFSESDRLILTFVTKEMESQYNFDFKLSFKFIGKEEAVVRYGDGFFRGNLLLGTPCSLLFNDCYKEKCSLQSPNYPGLYPRNVTCYYAIRHHNSPEMMDFHSVINLQTLDLNIQSRHQRNLTFSNSKNFKSDCVDTLTVYDGYTIRDPILMSVCGSGKFPWNVTSSSNELLVEFTTSGVNLFSDEQQALHAIQGFNMLATIQHIPLKSNKFVENHNCVFRTSSLYNKSGYLESPNHSLPSKTQCVYHIQGGNHELVWLQVIYYHVHSTDCNGTFLSIYDGPHSNKDEGKSLPILKICNNHTETLRSCEFRMNRNHSRPCNREESYTSTSNQMTIKTRTESGTIIDQLKFKIYYEFIDTKQDGLELRKPCSRLITQPGYFHSPRNTFLYGRGGRHHIHCIYQFMPGTINLEFNLLESPICRTTFNRQTRRHECSVRSPIQSQGQSHGESGGGKGKQSRRRNQEPPKPIMSGQIRYHKIYNNETKIQISCFCTNVNNSLKFSSKYPQQIELILQNMEYWVDTTHYFFNGTYNKEKPREEEDAELQTYTSLSGLIHLTPGSRSVVVVSPPTNYYYAYVFNSDPKTSIDCRQNILLVHNLHNNNNNNINNNNYLSSSSNSISNNNLYNNNNNYGHPSTSMSVTGSTSSGGSSNVFSANASNAVKVCPNEVNLYSPSYSSIRNSDNKLVLEYISTVGIKLNYVMIQKQSESSCDFYCSFIDGCLPSEVLCNGIQDCPDSSDEDNCHFNYNYEYLLLVFLIIIIGLISLFIYHNCTRRSVKGDGKGKGDS